MKKTIKLTAAGYANYEKELAELIAERPAIAERLATARAFGDLSENQEYSDARAEQKNIENRIAELEDILKSAEVETPPKVTFKMGGKKFTYTIVAPVEANPLEGMVSNISPIGKELLGRKAGDTFEFNGKKVTIESVE